MYEHKVIRVWTHGRSNLPCLQMTTLAAMRETLQVWKIRETVSLWKIRRWNTQDFFSRLLQSLLSTQIWMRFVSFKYPLNNIRPLSLVRKSMRISIRYHWYPRGYPWQPRFFFYKISILYGDINAHLSPHVTWKSIGLQISISFPWTSICPSHSTRRNLEISILSIGASAPISRYR